MKELNTGRLNKIIQKLRREVPSIQTFIRSSVVGWSVSLNIWWDLANFCFLCRPPHCPHKYWPHWMQYKVAFAVSAVVRSLHSSHVISWARIPRRLNDSWFTRNSWLMKWLLGSWMNPPSGTAKILWHCGHMTLSWGFLSLAYVCRQCRQNVWMHGRTFGSLNDAVQIEHSVIANVCFSSSFGFGMLKHSASHSSCNHRTKAWKQK